jgi:V/A-type H+-transporting ATPase subunit F
MKMMVVGHRDAVLGFSLAGVPGLIATTAQEIDQAVNDVLAIPDVGIVLVTDDVGSLIEGRMDKLRLRSSVPLFIEIPGPGCVRPDRPSLSEIIRRAIGVKI